MKKNYRCLSLFSGGLDSILAVLYMQKLGYEVIPIFFDTVFFDSSKAETSAVNSGLKLVIHDITDKHLEMVLEPKYGYGKNLNPCIDCHGLMFREAGELLKKYKADFIISGEVLGQRPMSQRLDALNAVSKLSRIKDLLIRPLSQKLLPDTKPIREGWVKKDEMLDIQGRNRKRQMQMIKDFGISEYQSPGGGCLLTDPGFSKRLKDLIANDQYDVKNIKLLKAGRHFRINENIKFILGRNKQDNTYLSEIVSDQIVMQTVGIPGPLGVISTKKELTIEELTLCGEILLRYNSKIENNTEVCYGENYNLNNKLLARKMKNEEVEKYLI